MDMITVKTAKHGTYEAPAEEVSAMLVLFRGKGIREMRIDWCDITHTAEWLWDDITDMATWAVMLAGRLDAPMYVRR